MTPATAGPHLVTELLGPATHSLLDYKAQGVPTSALHLPGPDFVDRVLAHSNRRPPKLRNFQMILDTGWLAGTRSRRCPGPSTWWW